MYRRIIYTWIVLITLAASITTLVDAVMHLEILNQPLDKKVIENRRIKLSCRVSNLSNKFVVKWYKNEQVITSGKKFIETHSDMQRFDLTGDALKGQYNLKIQKVQRSDSGNYTCRIYRMIGKKPMVKSRTALVQVMYYPNVYKFPECIRTQIESGIREYEIVPLCFSPVGEPPIRLDLVDDYGKVYQDGVYLDYSHRSSFVYLFVNISRNMDGFMYRCRARSPFFEHYEVKCLLGPVKVLKKPVVYIKPLQSTVNLADNVKYLCKAESESAVLEYKWEVHPNIEKSRISYFDDGRVITISDISKYDENTVISCSVRTEVGTTTKTTELKINKPETMNSPTTMKAMTTTEITEQLKTSNTEKTNNEQQTKTISQSTEYRTMFTETNLSALPLLKTPEVGNLFLALLLLLLLLFQFLVIFVACVFFPTRTKIKLPIETEFQVSGSTPTNPV